MGDEPTLKGGGLFFRRKLHGGGKCGHMPVIDDVYGSAGAALLKQQSFQAAEFPEFLLIVQGGVAAQPVGFRGFAAENPVSQHNVGKADPDGVQQGRFGKTEGLCRFCAQKGDLLGDGQKNAVGSCTGSGVPVILSGTDQSAVDGQTELNVGPADVNAAEHQAFGRAAQMLKPSCKRSIRCFVWFMPGRNIILQCCDRKPEGRIAFRGAQPVGNVDHFPVTAPVGPVNLKHVLKRLYQRHQCVVFRIKIQTEFPPAAHGKQVVNVGIEKLGDKTLLLRSAPARKTERVIPDLAVNQAEPQNQFGGIGAGRERRTQIRYP